MKSFQLWLLAVLLLTHTARAQWQRSDITKITYTSVFGGMFSYSNAIWLEIIPNGTIRMYNDTYKPDSTFEKLSEHGSGTISMADFMQIFGDSLAAYYSGKIAGNVYSEILNKIIQMQADTTHINNHCCCDKPYQIAMVYFKNGKKKFMRCDGSAKPATANLIHYLDSLAYKPGYKKALATFKFKLD